MCLNGVWGAVCADGWNEVATNIVCTQLEYSTGNYSGFSYLSSATSFSSFTYHSLPKVFHQA